jgi:hypothetical protein
MRVKVTRIVFSLAAVIFLPRSNVKIIAAVLILSGIVSACANSPTENYLAARDRYIASEAVETAQRQAVYKAVLKAKGIQAAEKSCDKLCVDALWARQAQELGDLERRLRVIIGPLDLDGFPREGTINLQTLVQELGFGSLDGLAYDSQDKNTRIVVTTDELLAKWLPGAVQAQGPLDIDGALKSEAFYTQSIDDDDAAITKFAEVPVRPPAGARFAFAMLVLRLQDYYAGVPDEIIVSVMRGHKLFIVSRRHAFTLDHIPICDDISRDYQARVDQASAAHRASRSGDAALSSEPSKLEEEGDIAYRRCFGEHAKEQSAFASVISQTQAIIDSLPAR